METARSQLVIKRAAAIIALAAVSEGHEAAFKLFAVV